MENIINRVVSESKWIGKHRKKAKSLIKFDGKVLIIGHGAVGSCVLPIFVDLIDVPLENITIIDMLDKSKELADWVERGITYRHLKITEDNLDDVFSKHLSEGDLLIDFAYNIGCIDIVTWCHEHEVLYLNTSVELWDPYVEDIAYNKTLYMRHMKLHEAIDWSKEGSVTAILDHGANPGLISHFTKQGILDIVDRSIEDGIENVEELKDFRKDLNFPYMAKEVGIKVIHDSERDTQVSKNPKRLNEFVGTWSIEGFREEGTTTAELGWGSHETKPPELAYVPTEGPKNQIFLAQMGINTWVRSYVPGQEIVGMIVRHGEAFSISRYLTIWDKNEKLIYRPTVHYAYMPCDDSISSLHELRCKNYELQPKIRILNDDIISGADTLGALLMGHRYKAWWMGTSLDIAEARRLVPNQNATTVQVAIGAIAAMIWMIKNPRQGVCMPEDIPHDFVLDIARPYLGNVISQSYNWSPFKNHKVYFSENEDAYLNRKNPWDFQNFLFRP